MRRIHPMTDEEQAFAETWHHLVYKFLRLRRLPEADYYDIVVFGFIAAVQWYIANRSTTSASFNAIAFQAMKDAITVNAQFHSRMKRSGLTLSLDEEFNGCEDLTLGDTLFDPKQNTIVQVESNILLHQAMRLATAKETAILSFVVQGYTVTAAAKRIGIKNKAAFERFYHFRRRVRAAFAG